MEGSFVLLIGLLSFCCLVYPASGLHVDYNNRCGYGYVWRHQTTYYCKYNTECCQIKGTWYCLNQTQSQLGCRTFQWGSHYKLFGWMINTTKLTSRYQTVPRFRKTTRLTSKTRPTTSVCRNKYRHRHRQRHTSKTYTKATIPIPHTTRPTTTVYVTKHRYRYIQRYGQRYRQRYRSKTYTKATTIPQTTRKPRSSTHSTYSDTKKTIYIDYILGFGIPLAVVLACFATVVLKKKCNDMTRVKKKTYADMVLHKSSAPPVTNDLPEYDDACVRLHNVNYDTVIASQRQRAGQPDETETNDIVDRNAAMFHDGYETKTALYSSAENVNETSEPPENLPTIDLPTYEEARCLSNCLYETSL